MGSGVQNLINKKAQATVEFLLVIAVLVPILLFALNAINQRVFGTIQNWIGTELQSRARYGYSYKHFQEKGNMSASQLTVNSGQPAVKYEGSGQVSEHPIAKVNEGWTQ